MNESSPPTRPPSTAPAGADRPRCAWWADGYAETLAPAIVLATLLHLGFAETVNRLPLFVVGAPPSAARPIPVVTAPRDFPVPANLLPESMRPTPPKFVDVNPMAPTAKPDHFRQTGAADQRAAQPDPAAVKTGDRPRMRGETETSSRVSQNTPREFLHPDLRPAPGQPLGRDTETKQPAEKPDAARALPGPDAGTDKPGPKFTPTPPKQDRAEKPSEDKASKTTIALGAGDDDGDTPKPKPRPKATLAGTSGPLGLNRTDSNAPGVLSNDSVFSRMGEYSARLYEIIQAAWWAGVDRSRIDETGTVVIEFTLHRDGSVTDARIVEFTTSNRAAFLCLDAVTGRAPFDKWPEDMVGMFGEKQEGRLTFHYR